MSLVHVGSAHRTCVAARQDSRRSRGISCAALGLGRGAIEHRVKRGLLHAAASAACICWGTRIDVAVDARAGGALRRADAARRDATTRPAACSASARIRRARSTSPSSVGGCERAGIRAHDVATLARGRRPHAPRHPRHAHPRARCSRWRRELTPRELADAVEQAQVKRLVTKRDIEADDRAGRRRARRRGAARAARGARLHPLVGGAAARRAPARGEAAAAGVQRQGRGIRGRRPLAPRARRAGVRLLRAFTPRRARSSATVARRPRSSAGATSCCGRRGSS